MEEMVWPPFIVKNMFLRVALLAEMVVMVDIVFIVDEGLKTLMDFRYNRHFKAERGENGMSKGKHGKNANAYLIPCPPGTTLYDEDTNQVLADLTVHGQKAVIANGGKGGKGN